jgi:hypothetical protein
MRKLDVGDVPAMSPGTPGHRCTVVITEQPPLAYPAALRAVTSCAVSTVRVLPGLRRDELLARPQVLAGAAADAAAWWRLAEVS